MVTINEALRYPFLNFKRLFIVWLALVPVWGWFVVYGYIVRMAQDVFKGKNKEAPALKPLNGLFTTGFYLFVMMLILTVVFNVMLIGVSFIPILGILLWLALYIYYILVLPMMLMQFAETGKIGDGLDFVRASKIVFNNFVDYITAYIKYIVIVLILLVASIPMVTMIITMPAMYYSAMLIFGDFFKNYKKKI